MSRSAKLAAALAIVLIALVPGATAGAAQQVPFTIIEHVDFTTGVNTFTATGPLCPSGTFFDDLVAGAFPHSDHAQTGGFNLIFRTTYTCNDGTGTFEMLKHVFISFAGDGFTNTGPVQILGGTGDYTNLKGHGVDNGVSTDGLTGVGTIMGSLVVR